MNPFFVIIGKIPPPIGGVRVHVDRLIDLLKTNNLNFRFVNLSDKISFRSLKQILRAKFIHLHTSNVWLRLFFSILCFIIRQRLIITYHGEIGRFSGFLNFLENISIRLAYLPIALNMKSCIIAQSLNNKSRLISVFIPPGSCEAQDKLPIDYVEKLRSANCKFVFCTTACAVSYDRFGREIYGIISLIDLFNHHPDLGLIVSDPTGAYNSLLVETSANVGKNIVILSFPHSFVDVIRMSDCMIRATTTDGDSISVREALLFNRPVVASDCVERPKGCILFPAGDFVKLGQILEEFSPPKRLEIDSNEFNGAGELVCLYKKILEYKKD